MTSEGHDRLEELFTAALGLTSDRRRTEFLDSACSGDSELRTRIEDLLSSHGQLGTFLEDSPITTKRDPDATVALPGLSATAEVTIGRYKIIHELGEGGFGTVYLAEQEQPVRRQVALKIIKLGMDTKQVIARFEAERQALALMEHPNIARVFDAGATESGRPYFVMELVKGTTVTDYCQRNALGTRERLQLFLPICHAIQHAHQKGVIHRDLKPSNILVTMREGAPVPKVIDFGIAKATSQRLTDKTLFTEMRQFIGTPEYMSPDQAEASGMDVDTRTDIYSLGVLLYELLTGATPFDSETLKAASYDELWRIIREVEPPKPSLRITRMSGTKRETGEKTDGDASLTALSRRLRGDLDWIVMKALEKDRTRRYATAKDFADDIERHLNHEPVLAGAPSWAYTLTKFVRRHRVGVVAASFVLVAIIAGFSLAMVGLVNANRSREQLAVEANAAMIARAEADLHRDLAQAETITSATVSAFLQEMLSVVDPNEALGRAVTVRFVLDEAARKIEEGALSGQPTVEASLRMTLGRTYLALGLYDPAEKQLRAAQSICTEVHGVESPVTLRANGTLAVLLRVRGELAESEALLRRTVDIQDQVLGPDDEDTLVTRTELALALQGPGRFEDAEKILRRVYEARRRVNGEESEKTLEAMVHLGGVCRILGQTDEAQRLLRDGLHRSEQLLGESHPCTRAAVYQLGLFREDRRELEQAESLYRRSYELDRSILGADHPGTSIPRNSLLRVLRTLQKFEEMRPLVEEQIARLRRAAERPGTVASDLHSFAWVLLYCELVELRDPAAALPFAERAVDMDGGQDANYLDTLAVAYARSGHLGRAIETQRRALAQVRAGGPFNRDQLESRLVEYLILNGEFLEATKISLSDVASRVGESLISEDVPGQSEVIRSEKLMRERRYPEAVQHLRICLTSRQKSLPEGHWLIADVKSRLGEALTGKGDFLEAEVALILSHGSLTEAVDVSPATLDQSIARIVSLYEAWDRDDDAERWRQRRVRPADPGSNR